MLSLAPEILKVIKSIDKWSSFIIKFNSTKEERQNLFLPSAEPTNISKGRFQNNIFSLLMCYNNTSKAKDKHASVK